MESEFESFFLPQKFGATNVSASIERHQHIEGLTKVSQFLTSEESDMLFQSVCELFKFSTESRQNQGFFFVE
jgi:hypothetical protein